MVMNPDFSCARVVFSTLLFVFSLVANAQSISNGEPATGITEEYVISKCNKIASFNATSRLDANSLAHLPAALLNNPSVVIAVDSAYSTERGWFFSAYASVILPGSTRPIAFAARNIAFNNKGLAGSSQARLALVTSLPIPINSKVSLELPNDGRNYIEFDCDGFRSINLKGNFIFDDGSLEPDLEIAPQAKRVTASFEVNTKDLNNIMMGVSITPFKISGINDLSFQVTNAVADFSDIVNPEGLILPSEYQQSLGENIRFWRGFYLQALSIRVKGMADDPRRDPVIAANNLLIDDLGVTGSFSASNILSLTDGSADGWPLSIDAFSIKLLFGKISGGALGGFLNVPFLGKDPVPYTAVVEQIDKQVNYRFSVATTAGKEYDAPFSAKITLDEGSVISLEKRNGKFIPSALLQGTLTVEHSTAKFKGIKFQDLGLTTRKPFLIGGVFSTIGSGSDQSSGVGFPLSIDSINLAVFQGKAAVNVAVTLNLMEKGFSASTLVQVLAKMEVDSTAVPSGEKVAYKTRQRWEFEKVKINAISIESETNAFYLKGKMEVYDNDPVYGTGFGGGLAFKINAIMSNPVKVTAYFGSMPTYRYWHLDAYVPTNIFLGPVVIIKGLQGGASYHMTRVQPFKPDFTKIDPSKMVENGPTNESTFVPDEKTGMAFMAGITLVVSNDAAVNADALFEVAFNPHGGLRYVQFTGSAFFFTPTSQRGRVQGDKVPSAPVFADLNMIYDNDNKVFHANLKTYLNVAGLLKGSGPNNLVGEAVIHTDPKDWYIYIGRPSQMFGVDLLGLASAKTYFMVGTQVEDIPPPPEEVREIFDDIEPGIMRDNTALGRGRGFATGAHLRVGFDKRIKPFYVVVRVGAGADIMLRDYGDAHCEGRSGKIGIDGWYASGQAYVFLKGKVGIRVRGNDFDIVSVGAAALLQAKLPNPTWLKGQLGGQYKILGGLVKGKFKIKMVIGEECEIVQDGTEVNIKVIADVKPDEGGNEVSVFSAPQVSFNTALDTEFTMMDAQDNVNAYRVKLAEFTATKDGAALAGVIEWNATKDVAILRTSEILPPQSKIKIQVKLFWEKKAGSGGWEVIKSSSGAIAYETRESQFTTGIAPDFIPEENVAYSYPIKNQYNFYVNESQTGYLKLRMGQTYLFKPTDGMTQWSFVARFQESSGKKIDVPLSYNESQASVSFEIPKSLSPQSIYKFFFIKRPSTSSTVDQNVVRSEVTVSGDENNEMTTASNSLSGTLTNSVDKDLYASVFRTSRFGKFEEKMATLSGQRDLFDVAIGNIAVIGKRADLSETFDIAELRGVEGQTESLVKVIASAETQWMKQYISPMLYDQYPVDTDVTLSWRTPEILGVKPLKGVKLTNDVVGDYTLTDAQVTLGNAPSKNGSILIGYYLSYYSFKDFNDLRNQAAAKYLNNWSSAPTAAKNLLSAGGFVDLLAGNYPVEITYSLPGINQVTYRKEIVIKN